MIKSVELSTSGIFNILQIYLEYVRNYSESAFWPSVKVSDVWALFAYVYVWVTHYTLHESGIQA